MKAIKCDNKNVENLKRLDKCYKKTDSIIFGLRNIFININLVLMEMCKDCVPVFV